MTWNGSAKPDGYIIGLTGTHGTGKSTVIKGLKERGIPVDESQLSRAAQKALGWESLAEVQKSADNVWLLQEAILQAMYDRDQRINESKIVTIVDRTPADVAAYTNLWLLKVPEIGEKHREYHRIFQQRCRVMASRYARHVYFPIREEIPFVAEAQRANEEDRLHHDKLIKSFLGGHLHTHEVESLSPDDRVFEVLGVLEYEQWMIKELEDVHRS